MSRFHVHLHVVDLEQSIAFYSALFGTRPTRVKPGYAKWMLDQPNVNFAVSAGSPAGVSHLGIQVDTGNELAAVSAQARSAAGTILEERGARCCYATGNKAWAEDPQGVVWEVFHTTGDSDEAGAGAEETLVEDVRIADAAGCGCSTKQETASVCCAP